MINIQPLGDTNQKIDLLYDRLKLSMYSILKMVEADIDFKGIFNPKKDKLFNNDFDSEFLNFQLLLKNLNNIVYYNSLILISYSIFEYSFKLICANCHDHLNSDIKFKDPKTDVLNKCKLFLRNEIKWIDFEQDGLEVLYDKILCVNKLRNLITHHNGNLLKDKTISLKNQKDYDLFNSDKRLAILSSGQVFIDDSEYIHCFIKDSESFLKTIIRHIINRSNEQL